MLGIDLNVDLILQIVIAFVGAYLAGLWLSLVIWTYRDIHSRSHDPVMQLLGVLMVLIFNLPGILLYSILRPRDTLAEGYERSLEEEALLQELDNAQCCPACKNRVEPEFLFCPYCQTRLRQPCPHCQRALKSQWETCPYCGGAVEKEAPAQSYADEGATTTRASQES